MAKAAFLKIKETHGGRGKIGIFSAGTADIPVAEEASETLEAMGIGTEKIYDVGVAGLHRIIDKIHTIRKTDAEIQQYPVRQRSTPDAELLQLFFPD